MAAGQLKGQMAETEVCTVCGEGGQRDHFGECCEGHQRRLTIFLESSDLIKQTNIIVLLLLRAILSRRSNRGGYRFELVEKAPRAGA